MNFFERVKTKFFQQNDYSECEATRENTCEGCRSPVVAAKLARMAGFQLTEKHSVSTRLSKNYVSTRKAETPAIT